MPVYADLHTHTHCSDGRLSPEALVRKAAEAGLRVLAVTDHDTVEGLHAAREAAEGTGLDLVNGVELSVSVDGEEIHLLGYGFDPHHTDLQAHLDAFVDARAERARSIVDRLHDLGVELSVDDVEAEAQAARAVGRPHVAAALVQGGHVDTVQEAFDRYLGTGRPAFVSKPAVPAREALALLHDAGGIGVLAHPGHWTSTDHLHQLVDAGLDGIESVHPSHEPYLRDYYRQWAAARGLFATGGSDYHGREERDEQTFGRLGLSSEEWEPIREALA